MDEFVRITEQESPYRHLEKMKIGELLTHINNEDKTVAYAVERAIPQIKRLVGAITDKMLAGGRLFYIGAGTSGRLAVVDASECPPTYGVPYGLVVAVIAGGERAITVAVENAEDDAEQGWKDLEAHAVSEKDVVVGLAASGTTPYVVGALEHCKKRGITTGSTRMKSGTAQKLVLNMISTTVMIQLGRVEDNKMVNMQLTNEKLVDRGTKMIMGKLKMQDYEKAKQLLLQFGSVKKAVAHARD